MIRAVTESGAEENRGKQQQSGFQNPAMEVSALNSSTTDYGNVWEDMSAIVRLTYGIGNMLTNFFIYMYIYINSTKRNLDYIVLVQYSSMEVVL